MHCTVELVVVTGVLVVDSVVNWAEVMEGLVDMEEVDSVVVVLVDLEAMVVKALEEM